MDFFSRFTDDGYKNWIRTQIGLRCLKTRLEDFLENETETYHKILRDKVNLVLKGAECQKQCEFQKTNPRSNQIPVVCKNCEPWKDEILANCTSKYLVVWSNCKPYLWPREKWEVAKVYMARGNSKHTSVDQFDISAFLNLMTNCKHFKFVSSKDITQVTNMRNQIMHTANWCVKKDDLEPYLKRIRELGKALEGKAPEFKALDDDINQLQNIDFDMILKLENKPIGQGDFAGVTSDVKYIQKLQTFLNQEQEVLKNNLESLATRYEEDRENVLTQEELQGVRVFLEGNKDLANSLAPQWERLRELQERVEEQGEQIHTLTDRVDKLEQNIPDSEFITGIMMYKNHLFEEIRKRGWHEPKFSEIKEASGYRGQVEVNGQTFTSSQVCRSIKNAHQAVAKLALGQLPNQSADLSLQSSESAEGEASNSQSKQPVKLSAQESAFFGSVTMDFTHEICEVGPGEEEAVESAYKKLAPLFGVEVSSDSSYKEAVLQYCQTRDIPLPEELSQSTSFTLKFTGPLTFHDLEGSSKKKQAQQQAAKVALQVLCGVLGRSEVQVENNIGALKELLEAKGLKRPEYDVTERGGGTGEGERGADKFKEVGGGGTVEKGCGENMEGTYPQPTTAPMMHSVQACESQLPAKSSMDCTPIPMDTSEPMEIQATATQPEQIPVSGDGGRFLGCVKVDIKKELALCEASSQEGAVQEAYRSLLHALSLDQTTTGGGERQCVLEFFRQADCSPPVEECGVTAEGKHCCKLSIMGKLTFHSQKGAAKKQQAEQWAAMAALSNLEGLLEEHSRATDSTKLQNYKGRLQELIVRLGGRADMIVYDTTDTDNSTTGQVIKKSTIVSGFNQQAEGLSSKHTVAMKTTTKNLRPPPRKRSPDRDSDRLNEEIRQRLKLSGLRDVACEDVNVEQKYEWRVCVAFDHFNLQLNEWFSSKKEAMRHAYLRLGLAGQICQRGVEEMKSKEKVLVFFSKNSFSKPVEVEGASEDLKFSCSLTDVTCVFHYCAEGPTEAAAHLSALQMSLSCLSSCLGYSSTVAPDSPEEALQRLMALLEKEGLKLAGSALKAARYKNSAQFRLTRYSIETKGQKSKKETKSQLCQRLLKLLGEETASSRNALDEWFVRKNLEKPQFEETDEEFGTKVTFSAPIRCITDWQDDRQRAESQLMEELNKKIQLLIDNSSH